VGFELFDKYNFGMTDFAQQLNYRRAIQGELERTISQLSGVEQARVHLVIPQDRLFQSERQSPSASVVLKLRTGAAPSEEEVSAVVHLVSAAVEGLKPEGVTVVDTRGRVLAGGMAHPGDEGSTAVLTGTALKLQQQYEQHLQDELQSMLDRAFGIGKAVVRVRAEMDFASRETQRETVQPSQPNSNTGVLLSRERVNETYSGTPPTAGGVPGTASNLRPPSLTGMAAQGTGSYTRTEESENYQVSKSVERVKEAPGSVKRLSIGVLVDGSLTPRQRTDIESMISAACGLDTTRGDRVTVASLPFDRKSLQADEADMQRERQQQTYLAYARIGAAVLVMLLFLLLARSALRGTGEPREVPALPQTGSAEGGQPLPPQEGLILESAEAVGPEEPPRTHRHVEVRDTPVRRLAQENPEEVAQLIRTWLLEQTTAASRR